MGNIITTNFYIKCTKARPLCIWLIVIITEVFNWIWRNQPQYWKFKINFPNDFIFTLDHKIWWSTVGTIMYNGLFCGAHKKFFKIEKRIKRSISKWQQLEWNMISVTDNNNVVKEINEKRLEKWVKLINKTHNWLAGPSHIKQTNNISFTGRVKISEHLSECVCVYCMHVYNSVCVCVCVLCVCVWACRLNKPEWSK